MKKVLGKYLEIVWSTNEFHNPIGAFRRKVDYRYE